MSQRCMEVDVGMEVDTGDSGSNLATIITSCPWKYKFHKINKFKIMLPDCGVRMRRTDKKTRDVVPPLALRLYRCYSTAFLPSGASRAAGTAEQCMHCKSDRAVDAAIVKPCSLCNCNYHDRSGGTTNSGRSLT